MHNPFSRVSLVVAGLGLAVAAFGADPSKPTVLYSSIQSSSTSDVPGLPGLKFDADTTAFGRPYRSADGQHWIMKAWLEVPSTADDEIILVGSGATGTTVVREGDQASWAPSGYLVGPIREKMSINGSGQYAFGQNLGGTAPTTADEQIVAWDGSTFNAVAVEGGAVPGVAGEACGTTLSSAGITDAGVVGYHAASTVGGLPATQDDFLIAHPTIVAQSGIAGTPTGQVGNETWSSFTTDAYYLSGSGKTFVKGTLTGSTASDFVVANNNQVVLQEGVTYAGLTAALTSTNFEAIMTPDGDWMARGETAGDAENFVMMNGTVISKRGDLVPGGLAGEHFSDVLYDACYFTMAANANGDFVYGGLTDNADVLRNAVLVYDNTMVVAREGDPVDLNGDGLFNDNAYINIFNNEDLFLTADGWLYFTVELKADDTTNPPVSIGQALIRFQVPEPYSILLLALGGLGLLRRR